MFTIECLFVFLKITNRHSQLYIFIPFTSLYLQDAMEVMGVIAVIVNCALIGMSGQVQRMFPNLSTQGTIILIVILEVCCCFIYLFFFLTLTLFLLVLNYFNILFYDYILIIFKAHKYLNKHLMY